MQMPDQNKDPFSKIISSSMLEQPSVQFTGNVLNRLGIETTASIKYEPVISLRGWIIIGVLIVALCVFGISGSGSGNVLSGTGMYEESIRYGATVFENLASGSVSIILSAAAAAILLLFTADGYYRRSRLSAT